MLSSDETQTFYRLSANLGAAQTNLLMLDAYYEGEQHLEQLGLAVPPELRDFVTIVNWPRTATDAVERRIDLEGFRLAGADDADDEMWRVWQANGLDEESQLAHLDALVFGRTFVCVGTNEDDASTPRITVESPMEVMCEFDPRTRVVTAAVRRYSMFWPNNLQLTPNALMNGPVRAEYATLYLPDVTIWLERSADTKGEWQEQNRDEHRLGVVPVIPLVNRPRTKRRFGVSEMTDIIPLTDAAARALTNAQVATEALAIPQRYVLGAQPKDFVDPATGENLTQWETYFGSVWALVNDQAKVGQFAAADLGNFTRIVDHYAGLVAGASGLPMRYFGQNTANPPSAEGIRADESQLIVNVRRKHRTWGGAWEQAMRIVRRLQDGDWNPDLKSMETLWKNPETPTVAQEADAVLKLSTVVIGGKPLLPLQLAREQLGWSAGDIKRAEKLDDVAPVDAISALNETLMRQAEALPTSTGPVVDQPVPPAAA